MDDVLIQVGLEEKTMNKVIMVHAKSQNTRDELLHANLQHVSIAVLQCVR
jgi:hypothetical protein